MRSYTAVLYDVQSPGQIGFARDDEGDGRAFSDSALRNVDVRSAIALPRTSEEL